MRYLSKNTVHKKVCKGTWIIPCTIGTNQIDHVFISKKRLSAIKDVRSMQGPNCASDLFLVRVKYKQKIIKIQGDRYEKKRDGIKKNWKIQVLQRNVEKKL